jgi:hypothetical protein
MFFWEEDRAQEGCRSLHDLQINSKQLIEKEPKSIDRWNFILPQFSLIVWYIDSTKNLMSTRIIHP